MKIEPKPNIDLQSQLQSANARIRELEEALKGEQTMRKFDAITLEGLKEQLLQKGGEARAGFESAPSIQDLKPTQAESDYAKALWQWKEGK